MTRTPTALKLASGAAVGAALVVTALSTSATADPGAAPSGRSGAAGLQQMHERMGEGNPGMQRMHELMAEGNPGMQRMHELMAEGNPGMQRMHEQMRHGVGPVGR